MRKHEETFMLASCLAYLHLCVALNILCIVIANTNLFVEADTYAHLSAVAGGSIVIPCRPTSPDLVPILSENNVSILETH